MDLIYVNISYGICFDCFTLFQYENMHVLNGIKILQILPLYLQIQNFFFGWWVIFCYIYKLIKCINHIFLLTKKSCKNIISINYDFL